MGEGGYGVAVANDATYGHDVTHAVRADGGTTTTVRLSLLKSPLYPDPAADAGKHRFTVTVQPGATIADAVREGYRVNLPERVVRGGRAVAPIVAVDDPAAVIEAVKLAEDGSGDVVVRVYESLGERVEAGIAAAFPCAGVAAVDLLERPLAAGVPHPVEDAGEGRARLRLRPFEIATVRFRRA